jgi:hypothetical protein
VIMNIRKTIQKIQETTKLQVIKIKRIWIITKFF